MFPASMMRTPRRGFDLTEAFRPTFCSDIAALAPAQERRVADGAQFIVELHEKPRIDLSPHAFFLCTLVDQTAHCRKLDSHADVVVVVSNLATGGTAMHLLLRQELAYFIDITPIEDAFLEKRVKLRLLV